MSQLTSNTVASATTSNSVMARQIRQLLWINKVIKYPFQSEEVMQTELPTIICALSQEFINHRNNISVTLQTCNMGSSHKKVIITKY